jgi:hypothetical protein
MEDRHDRQLLDRVSVMPLVAAIKRQLNRTLEPVSFEPNDAMTRGMIANMVEGYMSDIKERQGVVDYKVVCDESNNTPFRIDHGELYVDVFIKPQHATEYITIQAKVASQPSIYETLSEGPSIHETLSEGPSMQVEPPGDPTFSRIIPYTYNHPEGQPDVTEDLGHQLEAWVAARGSDLHRPGVTVGQPLPLGDRWQQNDGDREVPTVARHAP